MNNSREKVIKLYDHAKIISEAMYKTGNRT